MDPLVKAYYDPATNTISYLIRDPGSDRCAILDPVLDFDIKSGRISTTSADAILADIDAAALTVDWLLETHVHADHLSAGHYLKARTGAPVAIGARVTEVQETFRPVFNLPYPFAPDGRQFDRLFADGDTLRIGGLDAKVMHTPGHTPACISYRIGDAVFVGDTLFAPDYGTARCDFPGGDPAALYRSIQRILALPPETRVFLCHDYQPCGRKPLWETSVGEQQTANVHLQAAPDEAAFTALRTDRDKQLDMPVLILPSVQVNMRAGELPPPEDNGIAYLKLPLNQL